MKKHQAGLPNANDNEPPLGFVQELTEAETAKELRISIKSLRRERAEGKIGFAQRRRRVFYPMSCIEEYRQGQVTRCQNSSSGGMARRRILRLLDGRWTFRAPFDGHAELVEAKVFRDELVRDLLTPKDAKPSEVTIATVLNRYQDEKGIGSPSEKANDMAIRGCLLTTGKTRLVRTSTPQQQQV